MSTVTQANIRIDQGTEFETTIIIEDSNSDPVDLSQYEIFGQIRKTYASSKFFPFEIDMGFASEGEIGIRFPSSRSIEMRPGRYMYDIHGRVLTSHGEDWPDDSIQVYKFVEGTVDIAPRISKIEDKENG